MTDNARQAPSRLQTKTVAASSSVSPSTSKNSFLGYSRLQKNTVGQETNSRLSQSQSSHSFDQTSVAAGKNNRSLLIQVAVLAIIIIGLIALFLFAIFPGLVHYTGVKNSANYTPPEKQIKPQAPTFNAPPAHTNVDELILTGFAPADSQVQFIINDDTEPANLLSVGANGDFTFSFRLREGDNTLQAYTISQTGLESNLTKTYTINYDQSIPEIVIDNLQQESEIVGKDKKSLTIRGSTEAKATVLVNTQKTFADDEGNFELTYLLQAGDNNLAISASDDAGNQSETLEFKVKFTP